MLPVNFGEKDNEVKTFLFLGAHCDDIEIGCGGTIQKLVRSYPNSNYHWIVFSSNANRKSEAQSSATDYMAGITQKNIVINEFKNGYFPQEWANIKDYMEKLKSQVRPDVVFTHYRNDLHQDHRVVSELTWNTFRDNTILEYEIAKYDGDLGQPNCFVHLSKEQSTYKVKKILQHFQSQKDKHWFTEEVFLSLMRLRGLESISPSGYAEAFYSRKMIIFI